VYPIQVTTPATPRPDWLAARRAGVGASDIGIVLGLSTYGSPFSLYWDKVAPGDDQQSDLAATGHHLEATVADWWAGDNPDYKLAVTGMWRSSERPWQLATPDRLIYPTCGACEGAGHAIVKLSRLGMHLPTLFPCVACSGLGYDRDSQPAAVLECKWAAWSWDGWGEPGTGEIPMHYRCQVQWQMDVMGVPVAYVAALGPGGFRAYEVRADTADQTFLREHGRRFWQQVETGDAPPIDDGHPATTDTIKRLHPDLVDETVEIDVEVAEAWRRAKALTKRSEAVAKRLENTIRATMGNARRSECNGHLVASRSITVATSELSELDSLDTDPILTDRFTPGRTTNYREQHHRLRRR